jgi:hypothetical protein
MKKSDLMRNLVESKSSIQKNIEIIDKYSENEKPVISEIIDEILKTSKIEEEIKIEEKSNIIQYIKKKIIKIRN